MQFCYLDSRDECFSRVVTSFAIYIYIYIYISCDAAQSSVILQLNSIIDAQINFLLLFSRKVPDLFIRAYQILFLNSSDNLKPFIGQLIAIKVWRFRVDARIQKQEINLYA